MFKRGNITYLEQVYKAYENYMYLTDYTITQFLINRNFY